MYARTKDCLSSAGMTHCTAAPGELHWYCNEALYAAAGSTLLVGAVGASTTTFRTIWAIPVLLIYPLSIFVVYLGDYVFNWDHE